MTTPALDERAAREKRFVALSSVIAAIVLTGMKVVVGLATGSLGILSEAAHSGLDLVAAAMTLWAVRAAAHPPDREHTYGHGKFEDLSALFETLLLLATCVWIVYEAVERLFFRDVEVEASVWAFVVMAISIIIDASRSRALARVAKKYDSRALEADALHFSTDIWSSSVVIAGLFCVLASQKLGVPWLRKADSIAAVGVAAIVVWVSIRLGRKSIADLVDAVPADLHQKVVEAALVPGVIDVRRVRLRKSGPELFAEITLAVSRELALESAHEVAHAAEASVRSALPRTDVVVHVEPVSTAAEGMLSSIRLLASRQALGAHAIRIYDAGGRHSVELHLEVNENLRVGEAHDVVTRFEQTLRDTMPNVDRIVTHIEPVGENRASQPVTPDDDRPVRAALEAIRVERGSDFAPHDLEVQRVGGELSISFHVVLDAELSIADAHALTEQVEKDLRLRLPGLGRVVIHVEPPGEEADGPTPAP